MFGDTSKSDDNSSSRAFFICITFKLIPDVYGERDVGKERILLMNLSENKKIIGIQQPEIKKTVGALSGAATRSLENDKKLYMDFYTTYLAEKNEILSSAESVESFMQSLPISKVFNAEIKASVLHLGSLCLYEAVSKKNVLPHSSYDESMKMIEQAIQYCDEAEYHKLKAVLLYKTGIYDAFDSIGGDVIMKEFCSGTKNSFHRFSEQFYEQELRKVILEKTKLYRKTILHDEASYFLKNSLWNLPILIFFIYKYYKYVPPTGFFSFISWTPVYWICIAVFGIIYIKYISRLWGQIAKDPNTWKQEMLNTYKV